MKYIILISLVTSVVGIVFSALSENWAAMMWAISSFFWILVALLGEFND